MALSCRALTKSDRAQILTQGSFHHEEHEGNYRTITAPENVGDKPRRYGKKMLFGALRTLDRFLSLPITDHSSRVTACRPTSRMNRINVGD